LTAEAAPNTQRLAAFFVVATGILWGLYWVPVRALDAAGLPGAWGTLLIAGVACLVLAPFALAGARRLGTADKLALAALALGGFSFALYSIGLVYGRVAIVILLFYLTPVWSTLIGRALGWPMPWLRGAALVAGLAGLGLVLGADGGMPLPRNLGDWLGLASGFLWAVATVGIRTRETDLRAGEMAFVFAFGALAGTAVLAPILAPWPGLPQDIALEGLALPAAWTLAGGAIWWGLSMAALMWATARLEPARVGILLMSEVLVGVASAALFAGEPLGRVEMAGGALVILAAILEVWPARGRG
jgi:drug/metabolite transporter (DMT)-like permease